MDGAENDPKIAEALGELQQYLSDAISPLVASDSIALLLGLPPEVVAQEIRSWTTSQHRRLGASVPLSDYLYHAMRKLYAMGEFTLVPKDAMAAYLEPLKDYMLEYCPPEDRELLRENLSHLGDIHADLTAPAVGHLHSIEAKEASASADAAAASKATVHAGQQLAQLVERLSRLPIPTAPPGAVPVERADLSSQLLSLAARNAASSEEYEQVRESLRGLGVDPAMKEIIRSLGRRLPGWVVPQAPDAAAAPHPLTGTAQAMERIVTLEQDPREAARRFEELVQAAVEQCNEGSLARAVTMLDLASLLLAEKKVDPAYVRTFREQAHENLDPLHLRTLAEDADSHELLRRVLSFFPALAPAGLLDALKIEESREKRHLLLALLEVHGTAIRGLIADRLAHSVASFGDRDSHYQRNLLYMLRRIPRPDGPASVAEVQTVIGLSGVGRPVIVLKEAVTYLGQVKDERAEHALAGRITEYENALLKPGSAGYVPAELLSVLDRAVFALARLGTPNAIRAVVNHGLKRSPQLGATTARLTALSAMNLTGNLEAVDRLVQAIRAELPHKIFGFLLKKDWSVLLQLIEAVSSTTAQPVRAVLADIVQRFPEEDFAQVATRVLSGMDVPAKPAPPEPPHAARLSGDLELFGLPTLLQNLSQSGTTGVLTITDALGEVLATIVLEGGKFHECAAGHLRGETALFQLIERPSPASFEFVNRPSSGTSSGAVEPRDLIPLFFEGTRRYDELQQACTLVPDYACLRPTAMKPTRPPDEDDAALVRTVWQHASSGVAALQCENDLAVDSYRVRRMLAHWVEEGSLEPL